MKPSKLISQLDFIVRNLNAAACADGCPNATWEKVSRVGVCPKCKARNAARDLRGTSVTEMLAEQRR